MSILLTVLLCRENIYKLISFSRNITCDYLDALYVIYSDKGGIYFNIDWKSTSLCVSMYVRTVSLMALITFVLYLKHCRILYNVNTRLYAVIFTSNNSGAKLFTRFIKSMSILLTVLLCRKHVYNLINFSRNIICDNHDAMYVIYYDKGGIYFNIDWKSTSRCVFMYIQTFSLMALITFILYLKLCRILYNVNTGFYAVLFTSNNSKLFTRFRNSMNVLCIIIENNDQYANFRSVTIYVNLSNHYQN